MKRKRANGRERREAGRRRARALWERHYAIEAVAAVQGVDRRLVIAVSKDSELLRTIEQNFTFRGFLEPVLEAGRDPLPLMVDAIRRSLEPNSKVVSP